MNREKFFNTAGPSEPDLNYMIDPLKRIDLASIEALIEQRRYFVLHAPRQTGKTTALFALVQHLNASGRYRAMKRSTVPGAKRRRREAMQRFWCVEYSNAGSKPPRCARRFSSWMKSTPWSATRCFRCCGKFAPATPRAAGLSANRRALWRARCVGLPHPQLDAGNHHWRFGLQHQGQIAAFGQL